MVFIILRNSRVPELLLIVPEILGRFYEWDDTRVINVFFCHVAEVRGWTSLNLVLEHSLDLLKHRLLFRVVDDRRKALHVLQRLCVFCVYLCVSEVPSWPACFHLVTDIQSCDVAFILY